jgi:hypothetical protein
MAFDDLEALKKAGSRRLSGRHFACQSASRQHGHNFERMKR